MAQTHKCFACDEEINVEEAANTCSFCHKTFHEQCSLSTTAASAHLSIGFISCTFGCLQAFEAGRHYRQRTEHKCSQCDKTYSTASNLEAHVKSEHEQVTHGPCPCCSKLMGQHLITLQQAQCRLARAHSVHASAIEAGGGVEHHLLASDVICAHPRGLLALCRPRR